MFPVKEPRHCCNVMIATRRDSGSTDSTNSGTFHTISVDSRIKLHDTCEEQQLPGGPEVKNGQKQPGRLQQMKQTFETMKAILGPGFVIGMYEYRDRTGNHAIDNFQWKYNHPDLECDATTFAAIAYLDPGSLQADINVGTSSNLTLEYYYIFWPLCLPTIPSLGEEAQLLTHPLC